MKAALQSEGELDTVVLWWGKILVTMSDACCYTDLFSVGLLNF